jgi:hypothetical protein
MRTGGSLGPAAAPTSFGRRGGKYSGNLDAMAHDGFKGKFSLNGFRCDRTNVSVHGLLLSLHEDNPALPNTYAKASDEHCELFRLTC